MIDPKDNDVTELTVSLLSVGRVLKRSNGDGMEIAIKLGGNDVARIDAKIKKTALNNTGMDPFSVFVDVLSKDPHGGDYAFAAIYEFFVSRQ